jgi:electron-transferring-flavoprotein dehydrogenase
MHRTLEDMLRERREMHALVRVPAADACFLVLAKTSAFLVLTPPRMRRDGKQVISLSEPTRWMARQAEDAGVEICALCTLSEVLMDEENQAGVGVATNDMGVVNTWFKKPMNEAEVEGIGRVKLSAEGAPGSLTKRLSSVSLNSRRAEPVAKHMAWASAEVQRTDSGKTGPSSAWHTVVYPLDTMANCGSFLCK